MRTRTRPRRTMLGCGLLLAAALAGCGGGTDGGDGGAPADGDSTRIAVVGDATCTPPRPVDPKYFTVQSTGASWDNVTSYVLNEGIRFDADSVGQGQVRVCSSANCKTVPMRIQSVVGGQCLTDEQLHDGQLYMLALVTTTNADENTPVFGPGNQTNEVYMLVQNGVAHTLYQQAGKKIAFVENGPESGWRFEFCPELHPRDGVPRAQWRPTSQICSAPVGARSGPAQDDTAPLDTLDDDVDPTQLSYGWMACANGCCRFYGSPSFNGNVGQTGPPPPGQTGPPPPGQTGPGGQSPGQGGSGSGQPREGGPRR